MVSIYGCSSVPIRYAPPPRDFVLLLAEHDRRCTVNATYRTVKNLESRSIIEARSKIKSRWMRNVVSNARQEMKTFQRQRVLSPDRESLDEYFAEL